MNKSLVPCFFIYDEEVLLQGRSDTHQSVELNVIPRLHDLANIEQTSSKR